MTKADIFTTVRQDLLRSNADKRHPFRKVILSSFGDYPDSRYLIKRETTDSLDTILYTDIRTPKVKQLIDNPKATLLFYNDKKRIQVRCYADCNILTDGPIYAQHLAKAKNNPRDYQSAKPPGKPIDSQNADYIEDMHFGVIYCVMKKLDILVLSRDGHTRVEYMRMTDGSWDKGSYVVP